MSEVIAEITQQLILEFQKKKDKIILDRIQELGIEIDWDREKKSRFKSFVYENHEGGLELLFYNDGSERGFFVIGFETPPFSFDPSRDDYGMNMSFSQNIHLVNPLMDKYEIPSPFKPL